MRGKGEVALALASAHHPPSRFAAWLPPALYLVVALRMLLLARRLFAARVIGRTGMLLALQLETGLSAAAHPSWSIRRQRWLRQAR